MEDPVCTLNESEAVTHPTRNNETWPLVENCPASQELLNVQNGEMPQPIQCLIDHSSVGSGSTCSDSEKVHDNAATESEAVCIRETTCSLGQSLAVHQLSQKEGRSLSVDMNLEEPLNVEYGETPLQQSNCHSVGTTLYSGTPVDIDKHSFVHLNESVTYDIEKSVSMDENLGLDEERLNVEYEEMHLQQSNCPSVGTILCSGTPVEIDKYSFLHSEPVISDNIEKSASVDKTFGLNAEPLDFEYAETALQESNCLSVGATLYNGTPVEIAKHSFVHSEPVTYDNIEESMSVDTNFMMNLNDEPLNVKYEETPLQEPNCLSVGATLYSSTPIEIDMEAYTCTVEALQVIHQSSKSQEEILLAGKRQPFEQVSLNDECEMVLNQGPQPPVDECVSSVDASQCSLKVMDTYSSVEIEPLTNECIEQSLCTVEKLNVMHQSNQNQECWTVMDCQPIAGEPPNGELGKTLNAESFCAADEYCRSLDASHCSDNLEPVNKYSSIESEPVTKGWFEESTCTVEQLQAIYQPNQNLEEIWTLGESRPIAEEPLCAKVGKTPIPISLRPVNECCPSQFLSQSHVIPQIVQNGNVSLECGQTSNQETQYPAKSGHNSDSFGGVDSPFTNGEPMSYEYTEEPKCGADESQPTQNDEETWPLSKDCPIERGFLLNVEYEKTHQQTRWPGEHCSVGDKSLHINNLETVATDSYTDSEQVTSYHSHTSYHSLGVIDTSFIKSEPLCSESEEEPMCTENELQEVNQPTQNGETCTFDKTAALGSNCLHVNHKLLNAKNEGVTQQIQCYPSHCVNLEGTGAISVTESAPYGYLKVCTGSPDQSLVGHHSNQSGEILPSSENLTTGIQKETEMDKNGERFNQETQCSVDHHTSDNLLSSSSSFKDVDILSLIKTEPVASGFDSMKEPTCTPDQSEVGHQPMENYADTCHVIKEEHMDTFTKQRQRPVDQASLDEEVSSCNSRTFKDAETCSSIKVEPMSCDSVQTSELPRVDHPLIQTEEHPPCDLIHHIKQEPLNEEYEESWSEGSEDPNNQYSVGADKAYNRDSRKDDEQPFIKSESDKDPKCTVDQLQAVQELTQNNCKTRLRGINANQKEKQNANRKGKQVENRQIKQNANRNGKLAAKRKRKQNTNGKGKQNANRKSKQNAEPQDDSWQMSSQEQTPFIPPNSQVDEKPVVPKQKKLSCEFCGKLVVYGNLPRHILIHTNEKAFCCDVCGKAFHQKCTLDDHKRIHTGERPFTCSNCGRGFKQRGNLKTHQRRHACTDTKYKCQRLEKALSCGTCGKAFNQKSRLEDHLRIHTGKRPFPCSDSGKVFHVNLGNDQQTHTCTDIKLEGLVQTSKKEKAFCCGICGKVFNQKSKFKDHQRLHTGERPFLCSVCGKAFKQFCNLRQHERSHECTKKKNTVKRKHDDLEKLYDEKKPSVPLTRCMASNIRKKQAKPKCIFPEVKKEPIPCPTCGKLFGTKARLYSHQLTHSGVKSFVCSICSKAFSQSGHLKTHGYIHSKMRPFTCHVCKKGFNQKFHMLKHMHRSHPSKLNAEFELYEHLHKKEAIVKNKPIRITRSMATEFPNDFMEREDSVAINEPVPCPVCNTLLANKISLVKHFLVYGPVKRFPCCFCSKTFVNDTQCKEHKRRHKIETPFICIICGMGFNQRTNMRKHRKKIHGATPAADKSCSRKSELDGHCPITCTWEEKPCICSTCNQAYTTLQSFVKHSCTVPSPIDGRP